MSLFKSSSSAGPSWRALHPRSWVTWRRVRRVLVGVAALTTLVALFYAVENWRGRRAWDAVAALARSRGEPASWAEMVPPPVPDAENFAVAPIVASLLDSSPEARKKWSTRWSLDPVTTGQTRPSFHTADKAGDGGPAAWRAYLGTDDLIGYMERYRDSLAQLTEASRRPKLRRQGFPADELLVVNFWSGLLELRQAEVLYGVRVIARIERGDRGGALEDVLTQLRLAELTAQEPFLVSSLIAASQEGIAEECIRFGIERRAWTAADLERIDAALARLDIMGRGWAAFRGESVWSSGIMREAAADSRRLFEVMGRDSMAALPGIDLLPSGWLLQNGAALRLAFMENVLPLYDATARRVDLARLQALSEGEKPERWTPYRCFVRVLMVSVDRVGHTLVRAQTRIDQARVALALERWRLSHDTYPAALAELPVEWGVGNLHDLATGEPFHYKRDERGGFLLYAIGGDGVDDGGRPVDPAKLWSKGDWVW
jgi:hypothetical protein